MSRSGLEPRAYHFDRFRLDPQRRVLSRDGLVVPLTPTVFDLLLCLVAGAGQVVTKDELASVVWSGRDIGDSTISQTIHTLRRALESAGASRKLVATVVARGYRFTGEVRLEPPVESAGQPLAPEDRSGAEGAEAAVGPRRRLVLGAALVAAVALGVFTFVRSRPPRAPVPPQVVVQADFQNLTDEPSFAHALGNVVEADLGQSPDIRVLGGRQIDETLAQMGRPPDAGLDARLAVEVCRRNNGQQVVEGSVTRVGRRFLVVLKATGCTAGLPTWSRKALVERRDDVIPALDRLIAQLRRRMGDTPQNLRRFDVAVLPGETASLDALEAYSEGVRASDRGRLPEAVALQQHAVSLDPRFAAAHLELGRALFNMGRYREARQHFARAFELRASTNPRLRYAIEILYFVVVELDYVRALALAKAATDVFPDHLIGWGQQANLDIQFGRYDEAIAEARRELALDPWREGAYDRLADALRSSGRFDEALQVCRDAAARHIAGGLVAGQLGELAAARGDDRALTSLVAEARGRPWEASLIVLQAELAYGAGQVRRGNDLFDRAAALYAAAGQDDQVAGFQAQGLELLGERDEALRRIGPHPTVDLPLDTSKIALLYTFGETGQSRLAALLDQARRDGPSDTTLNLVFGPVARAELDLAKGRARAALAELSTARPYEGRDNAAPWVRARAYIALGDGVAAAAEFHRITDHPGVDPSDIRHPLAWLGLARAEALQGRLAESRSHYRLVLDRWRDADPGVPVVLAARRELIALEAAQRAGTKESNAPRTSLPMPSRLPSWTTRRQS